MNKTLHYKNREIIEWLICGGIFCSHYVELFCLSICLIILFSDVKQIKVSKYILSFIALLGLYSMIAIATIGYEIGKFIQQFTLIAFYIISYATIFPFLKGHLDELFTKYLKIAIIIAFIGIIQWIVYILFHLDMFHFLYNRPVYSMGNIFIRISSIMDEPGYLSIALTPCVVYFTSIKPYPINFKKIAVVLTFILTFSAISYVVLGLSLLYSIAKKFKLIFLSLIVLIPLIISYSNFISTNNESIFKGITERIDDSLKGINNLEPIYFERLNLSSYALISNLWVAINAPNRIYGTGLGTHEQNYLNTYKSDYQYYGFNQKDGYSLFNRIFSEFGIIGLFVLFIFVFKWFNSRSFINICAFFLILSFILKGGHYVRYGLIFWTFMYYYSHKLMHNNEIEI